MAEKVKITGTLTLVNDDTITVEDDPANGGFSATAVRDRILKQDQSVFDVSGVETIIPYHSILKAEFTRSTVTVTDPVDASCIEITD